MKKAVVPTRASAPVEKRAKRRASPPTDRAPQTAAARPRPARGGRRSRWALIVGATALAALCGVAAPPAVRPWEDPSRPVGERADALVAALTRDEKIALLSGGPGPVIKGVPRVGLPPVRMSDGPLGLKMKTEAGQLAAVRTTSFPAGMALAATFDVSLLREVGGAIGRECRAHGADLLLGPSVNIYRVPQCGRNYEYFGEDPYLAGELAVGYTLGLQAEGVMASVKHFAANNQEYDRYRGNSVVDERTLQEIYFPAFRAVVQRADIASVMTAHNPLNGVHCSDNAWLLTDVLRGQWGYEGFVVSDWYSTYETVPVVKGGVDLEMPIPRALAAARVEAELRAGTITAAEIDAKVRRIAYACLQRGIYGPGRAALKPVDDAAQQQLVLRAAREGLVLLKNQHDLLPLDRNRTRRIVVLGSLAIDTPYHGGGAASVPAHQRRSLVADITAAVAAGTQVHHFADLASADAREQCAAADAVVVAAGFTAEIEGEAHDRPFDLLPAQVELIRRASELNAHTVVVLMTGGGVNISPWLERVAALVHTWYLGDGCGHVVGELLFGDFNPSGKLPISIERRWADSPASANYDTARSDQMAERLFKPAYEAKYGVIDPHDFFPINYAEGIFVGYRHYDARGIAPLFPFGFGLSYTTFRYGNLAVENHDGEFVVAADITNTGARAGAEVVQLYVGAVQPRLPRPPRELKRFARVELQPGETRRVEFTVGRHDLAFFDPAAHAWQTDPGTYEISVAASSRDLRLTRAVRWPQ